MNEIIDLRSDTVTKPSPDMRRAMAEAEVGDDVKGEDPTINALEEKVAELLGKEAAMYVVSGTQSNQVCVKVHTQPGDMVIGEAQCHILNYEGGAPAFLGGVTTRPVAGERGILDVSQFHGLINPDDPHFCRTRLVCLENTHNRANGTIYPLDKIRAISDWAAEHDLRMHLDGARLMNAAVASGIPAREYAECFDSVSICFSKGLGAPVGSACAGSREFIHEARRVRKILGGGMRQGGIIAAGALYALEHNVERLAEDHENCRILAEAVAEIDCFNIDLESVQTNLAWFTVAVMTAEEAAQRLAEEGVLVVGMFGHVLRIVTHLDVSREQCQRAADIMRRVFGHKTVAAVQGAT